MGYWNDHEIQVEASPMKMLIERIEAYFEIVIFQEEMILNDPIETWPVVDALMGWHSDGNNSEFH